MPQQKFYEYDSEKPREVRAINGKMDYNAFPLLDQESLLVVTTIYYLDKVMCVYGPCYVTTKCTG